MATGCNRNERREERGHLEIGETCLSALALRTFPATAVACKSVSTCITYVPSYCCCMQVCQHLHYVRSQLLLLHASLSALALRTFPATAVACKSVIFLASPSFMQGMLILCLAVGKMDICYPPSSFPMELPDTLKDFLAK